MPSIFIDTNIWVYAFREEQHVHKALIATRLVVEPHIISTQVVSETLYTLQRKFGATAATSQSVFSRRISQAEVKELTLSTLALSLKIREKYGYAQYDAQIIAAAVEAGCHMLYTEDMHHGQVIDGQLTITNPFAELA
jgi:predicted nucleic acid-binding protein